MTRGLNRMATITPHGLIVIGTLFLILASYVVFGLTVAPASDPVLESASVDLVLRTHPYAAPQGYWLVGADGGIFAYGSAGFFGSRAGAPLAKPVSGMDSTPSAGGYWLTARDGGVFAYGTAPFLGSMGGKPLNGEIVGIAATLDGGGYWLVGSDGGVFAFGNAAFFGSMGGKALRAPIVGIARTPSGAGYWLFASDGGVFAFGDAGFFGSLGSFSLAQPIAGGDAIIHGCQGYWLIGKDGGVFAVDACAGFHGSAPDQKLTLAAPAVGISAAYTTSSAPHEEQGYWGAGADGGVFAWGTAQFHGSRAGQPLAAPIVGIEGKFS